MNGTTAVQTLDLVRVAVEVQGAVQGVGYRPQVYRLATECRVVGFVRNHSGGVTIEVEGPAEAVETFLARLRSNPPPLAIVTGMQVTECAPRGESTFAIVESRGGAPTALLLPDVATCPACLADLRQRNTTRTDYPFTNCTHCGPRFSIVRSLPYDRAATTMAEFPLCPACAREYNDPADRRFHAQPTACASCGPALSLLVWRDGWLASTSGADALAGAVEALLAGAIVAVKGLGGFHLMVDAGDEGAVRRLRRRKGRDEKPLALIVR
ncbi:MAG: acylphosphatase, partial [Caldilineaceae bacterium]